MCKIKSWQSWFNSILFCPFFVSSEALFQTSVVSDILSCGNVSICSTIFHPINETYPVSFSHSHKAQLHQFDISNIDQSYTELVPGNFLSLRCSTIASCCCFYDEKIELSTKKSLLNFKLTHPYQIAFLYHRNHELFLV